MGQPGTLSLETLGYGPHDLLVFALSIAGAVFFGVAAVRLALADADEAEAKANKAL